MKVKVILALLIIGITSGIAVIGVVYYDSTPPGVKVEKAFSVANSEKSYVKIVNGTPELFVGDKETEITGFYTTSQLLPWSQESVEPVKKYIDKAAKHNFTFVILDLRWLFMDKTSLELAPPNIWELYDAGEYEELIDAIKPMQPPEDAAELIDWTLLDELFDYAESRGVYLVPCFVYHTPPLWWLKNYKTNLQKNNTGKIVFMPCFNSPAHEKYTDQVITAMVKRYKNHPALLGWNLGFGYTEENNYPGGPVLRYGSLGWYDYSEFAEQRFREYLKDKYSNNSAELRQGWNNESLTFENAEIPQPLPDIDDFNEMVDYVNSGGDERRQFYDWQFFRLEEKKRSRDHFAELYKTLDPNHVLFCTSSLPLTTFASGFTMETDYYEYAFSSYIDLVLFNPGVSNGFWENPLYRLICHSFIKYFQNHGKPAFITWEDWGCTDLEEIKKCAEFARRTSSGLVIWEGKNRYSGNEALGSDDDEFIDEFTDKEIATFAKTFHTTPEEKLEKSEIAIIEEPMAGAFDYRRGTEELDVFSGYKGYEPLALGALLISAGEDFDVVATNEIVKNPEILKLKSYKVVALVNLGRMDEKVLNALLDYRARGGGLFVVGRTGLFDEYGNRDASYLKRLLNVTTNVEVQERDKSSWHFAKGDALLKGIESREIRGDEILYLPSFDYEKEGYKVLGQLNDNPEVATVGCNYKERTLFWFPSLRTDEEKVQIFLQNYLTGNNGFC